MRRSCGEPSERWIAAGQSGDAAPGETAPRGCKRRRHPFSKSRATPRSISGPSRDSKLRDRSAVHGGSCDSLISDSKSRARRRADSSGAGRRASARRDIVVPRVARLWCARFGLAFRQSCRAAPTIAATVSADAVFCTVNDSRQRAACRVRISITSGHPLGTSFSCAILADAIRVDDGNNPAADNHRHAETHPVVWQRRKARPQGQRRRYRASSRIAPMSTATPMTPASASARSISLGCASRGAETRELPSKQPFVAQHEHRRA